MYFIATFDLAKHCKILVTLVSTKPSKITGYKTMRVRDRQWD